MIVPFLDLEAAYRELADEFDEAYRRVMGSGRYILGDEVEAFESEFADYCGTRWCVSVGNGLDALHFSLRAHDVGPGDDVLVPANTFIATWLAVRMTGATPVAVDVDPRTRNISEETVRRALTVRTRAVVPVHLYGLPADMTALLAIARDRDLVVIEDAAQAHGATHRAARAGGLGHAAAWSFYPGKNLGAFGDGGAITTNDERVARTARLLRNYGSQTKYIHETFGVNSRLDPLQAAFLRVKLAHLDEWNARRRRIAELYEDRLRDLPGVTMPFTPDDCVPAWHLFVVEHRDRVRLGAQLASHGITTLVHYPVPIHLSPAFRDLGYGVGAFPVSERLARDVLSLPIGPHLTAAQASYVAATFVRGVEACASAQ